MNLYKRGGFEMRKKFLVAILLCSVCLLSPFYSTFAANPPDTVVIALDSDLEKLHAPQLMMREDQIVGMQIYDTLLHRSQDMEIGPGLAESYHSINSTTYEFKLRKGVKFHNGEPFTAHAVKHTIEFILTPENKSPMLGRFSIIKEVKIIDDYTLRIITTDPWPLMEERLCLLWIHAPKYLEEKGAQYYNEHPVGTGPFRFVKWVQKDEVVLKANKEYWRGAPKFENLIFRVIPESSSRLAALRTGAVDIVRKISPDQIPLIEKWDNTRLSSVPILRVVYFFFPDWAWGTKKDSPVNDKRVRMALNLAIDRNGIVNNLLMGKGKPLATIVNPSQFGYDPALKVYPYDPEGAKKLLAEAGYPNGFTIDMNQVTSRVMKSREIVAVMIDMFKKVGVTINLHYHDQEAAYTSLLRARKLSGIAGFNWGSYGIMDAEGILWDVATTNGNVTYSTLSDQDVDKWLLEARSTIDKAKRKDLFFKVQRRMYDLASHIPLHSQYEIEGVNKRLIHEARADEYLWAYDIVIKK